MSWIEIELITDASLTDVIADTLFDYGYQGIAIEQLGILPDKWDEQDLPPAQQHVIRAYLPDDERLAPVKQQLEQHLSRFAVEMPVYRNVQEEDWAEAWKAHYHPIRIGQHIVIRPEWESFDLQTGDIEIVLDPGMAFGTGTHPTTQLCLEAVETDMPTDGAIVDLGCGSGILSIAAAKMGAKNIFAIDIDPIATKSAAANIERNHTANQITVATGGLADVLAREERYDFAFVNILARIIIQMCDEGLGDMLRPGGIAILSGIIETQVDDVKAALKKTGLEPVAQHQMGDWIRIKAEKPKA